MKKNLLIGIVVTFFLLLIVSCQKDNYEKRFSQFNKKFFAKHVPEFPDSRLATMKDIKESQQKYFEENNAKLQFLYDLNGNGTPEYIICGVSDSILTRGERRPFFAAIFEQTEQGIERQYLQGLNLCPVNLEINETPERTGVVLYFKFFSDFAAEIYYQDDEYHLDKWYMNKD